MRHQSIRPGMFVRVVKPLTDANGQPLHDIGYRVVDMYLRDGYREPWIILAMTNGIRVNGQFRAKELACIECGGKRRKADRFLGTETCPNCAGRS